MQANSNTKEAFDNVTYKISLRCAPKYRPLDPEQRQIRILHLLPGQYDDPVRCTLRTVSLDGNLSYEALSYSWGDPYICHVIEVDDQEATVTSNLYNVLRRLRLTDRTRHIWVDALCINQADTNERTHQVGLMRSIYSSATEGILWLGDFATTATSDAGANYISANTAATAFALLKSMAANHHWNSQEHAESMANEDSVALATLLNLSWWQRAWTVQEAVLPKKATLYCGTLQLPLSEAKLAHLRSVSHERRGCCVTNPQSHDVLYKFWDYIESLRLLQEESDKNTLIRMALEMFRFRNASDRRDCVYAYLGLGSKALADYTIPHETAFRYVVRSLIQESKNLGPLLRIAEHDQARSQTLPSWCPDYGSASWFQSHEDVDQEFGWLYMYSWYRASGQKGPLTRYSLIDSWLDLEGVLIDKVAKSEGPMYNTDDKARSLSEWHQRRDPRCCQRGPYEEVGWCEMMRDIYVVFSNNPRDYTRPRTRDGFETIIESIWDPKSQLTLFQYQTFTTETGLVGHARVDMRAGDVIAVLLGGNMPFILRPLEDGTFGYVGQVFVHGIMDGEALQQGRELRRITLV
ncbi:heterokaryon incompatibility (het-6OR allele) [Fusarium beomiforme]|uniref:Heterokaryon incompatibility (Het-6OR allele) n=1 Tax=Fusarium beomiforme TaxID=44412 RepID=A0A9P5AIM3_9HYPO|nr:heterokaryon incompatibility (het-6OR allele) [Fusarium beomiforme]